jgi:HEAT repeat protein
MHSDDEIRQIIFALKEESNSVQNLEALATVRNSTDERFLSYAIEILRDSDEDKYIQAYQTLENLIQLPVEQVMSQVRPLFEHPIHCAWAIHQAARLDVNIVSSLAPFVLHTDNHVRYTALWAIDGLGHPNRVEIALHLLNDENPQIRAKACLVLSGQGNFVAVESLIARLNDDEIGIAERPVSADAATALGIIGDESAIDALQTAARFGSEELACCALRALSRIDAQASEDFFLDQIQHPNERVRREVVDCLGSLGANHVDVLISTLQNEPSYRVQLAIANSLGFIGTPEARTASIHWHTHYKRDDDAFP